MSEHPTDSMRDDQQQKQCSKCGLVLPLTSFSPDNRMRLGVGSQCKRCNSERMKPYSARTKDKKSAYNRHYSEKNKDELAAKHAAWLAANADAVNARKRAKYAADPSPFIAAQQKYRDEQRPYIRLRQRLYYYAHKMEHIVRNWRWRKANPEKFNASLKRRRALKMGATIATLTAIEWEAIKKAADYRCIYCGQKPAKLTQDHVIPLVKGGPHTADNVVPACQSCNSSKGVSEL